MKFEQGISYVKHVATEASGMGFTRRAQEDIAKLEQDLNPERPGLYRMAVKPVNATLTMLAFSSPIGLSERDRNADSLWNELSSDQRQFWRKVGLLADCGVSLGTLLFAIFNHGDPVALGTIAAGKAVYNTGVVMIPDAVRSLRKIPKSKSS